MIEGGARFTGPKIGLVNLGHPSLRHHGLRSRLSLLHLKLNGDGETAYAFANLLGLGGREVQPQVAEAFSFLRIETVAGHESDVLIDGGLEETIAIHSFRQRHPQEESALRTSVENLPP